MKHSHVCLMLLAVLAVLLLGLPGCRSRTERTLADAVAGGDSGEITRAFHEAIYDHFARMRVSLPALRAYLTHANPYVRYSAARSLYVAGDRTGYTVLLDLVRSSDPVWLKYDVPREVIEAAGTDKEDLRMSAAAVLGKYRQKDAASAILALQAKAPSYELINALKKLGLRPPPAEPVRFVPGAAESYGVIGAVEFVPDLVAALAYPHPPDLVMNPELGIATQWALAELTGDQRYVEGLASAAREALYPPSQRAFNYRRVTSVLRYLGTLRHPTARRMLEEALECGFPAAVEVAVVNLFFNQEGDPGEARQVILRELHRPTLPLSLDLVLNLAASLNDSEIRTTAETRNPGGLWHLYAVERRDWPIYNWVDDYVVKLNGIPKRVRPERVFAERGG